MTAHDDLSRHIAEYHDLLTTINVLAWDMRTYMPVGGAVSRGYQLATLNRLAQEKFTSAATARLLDAAEAEIAGEDENSYRVRSVGQTRQYYDIMRHIPAEVVGAIPSLAPQSETIWAEAKKNSDFATFRPYLQKMLDFNKQLADAIGYTDHPYDALLFIYEPGMTAAKLKVLFAELKAGVLPLLERIVANDKPLARDLWQQEYPIDKQKAFATEMVTAVGYDFERGRLDIAPHPFEISFTRHDVRITTRYNLNYFPMAFFGSMHEAGHALYEQNVSTELTRTALTADFIGHYAVGGASYGAHEFSSRLWENQIGRSRIFWQKHLNQLREFFPEQLADVDVDLFYRAVNRVRPSLIRVEADEVTYNLHIMLRVEIEMGLLDGSLRVDDLPEIWKAKMQEYLGVVPPNDGLGVLQDVHWSGGNFGSFPTYTIGNVMAAQVFAAAHQQIPNLDDTLEDGNYQPLREWLTTNIYQHGRAYSVSELLQRVTGVDLHVAPYLAYLDAKFSDLYEL
jgi:carboxypeptidase Taq